MDWGLIFTTSLSAAVGVFSIVYCLAAIGINIQFGYTGLLNFGQAAFLAVAAYGMAVSITTCWPLLGRHLVGLAATAIMALISSVYRPCDCAPTTWPSSRLPRRKSFDWYFRSVRSRTTSVARTGFSSSAQAFSMNPFDRTQYGIGRVKFNGNQMWVMVVGWSLVALFRFWSSCSCAAHGDEFLRRSAKTRTRFEPGQERLLVQDAVALLVVWRRFRRLLVGLGQAAIHRTTSRPT